MYGAGSVKPGMTKKAKELLIHYASHLLPPITEIGIIVRVVIWGRVIIWVVWVWAIISNLWRATAFRSHYPILRESDKTNRISV